MGSLGGKPEGKVRRGSLEGEARRGSPESHSRRVVAGLSYRAGRGWIGAGTPRFRARSGKGQDGSNIKGWLRQDRQAGGLA